ncbi:MAG: hypothetical protein FWE34_01700 [Defluviitaleaceae bacterium]|nr:hypothetical protein [Defluviitaleaceae bacterium]
MLKYDFTYADLAVKFSETGDSDLLHQIAEADAARHPHNHADMAKYDIPRDTILELFTHYLTAHKTDEGREKALSTLKTNIVYAKENIVKDRFAEKTALQYLSEGFVFAGSIFFYIWA